MVATPTGKAPLPAIARDIFRDVNKAEFFRFAASTARRQDTAN
jgi:hypothetical protein